MSTPIKLQSPEGTVFDTTLEAITLSKTLDTMIKDSGGVEAIGGVLPVANVNDDTLKKFIDYVTWYTENTHPEQPESKIDYILDEWESAFCNMEHEKLFELILVANYLDVKPMLDATCKTVADKIKGKTPEEIRQTFGIVNDFTPEEEEQIRKENEWYEG
jgi:S-phase kinase-associated protein 1